MPRTPPTSRTNPTATTLPTESELTLLSVAVRTEDVDWLLAMMRASGCPSFDALARAAFYSFGRHLDIGMPTSAFPVSTTRPRRET